MDTSLETFKQRGLTEDEARIAQTWVEGGKLNAARLNLPMIEQLYVVGYSVVEISENFPEFPLGGLYWARANYKWDEKRVQKKQDLSRQTVPAAIDAKIDGIRFITEIIGATHVKWRQQIIKYMANPEREAPPECLPKSLHQYGALQELLQDMTAPPDKDKGGGGGGLGSIGPLVNVTINSDSAKTIEVQSGDAKSALKKALGKDKS